MKAKVTKEGLVIPKQLLEGVEEVEIRKEENLIVVVLISKDDPMLGFGKHPVPCQAPDASEHHDKYIYGSSL